MKIAKNVLLVLCCIVFTAHLVNRYNLAINYKGEMGGIERNVIFALQYAYYSGKIYNSPLLPPHFIVQYTPLHYELVLGIGYLIGCDFSSPAQTVELNRIICFLFNILETLVIFLFLHNTLKISSTTNLIVSILIFCNFSNLSFSRPDAAFSLFFISVVLLLYKYLFDTQTNKIYLPILLATISIACIFSKQSGIILLPIVSITLLFYKGLKPVVIYSLVAVILLSVLCFAYWSIYGHEFYENVVLGLQNGRSLGNLLETLKNYLKKRYLFVALIPLVLLHVNYSKKKDRSFWNLFLLGIGIAQSLFALKTGSAYNYYMELDFLLLIYLALNADIEISRWNYISWIFFSLLTLNGMVKSYFQVRYFKDIYTNGSYTYSDPNKLSVKEYITQKIRTNEKVFVLEQDGLDNYLYRNSIVACKNIYVDSYNEEVLGMQDILKGINNGKVKYLISPIDKPYIYFLNQSFTSFEVADTLGQYVVFKYKGNSK